jgi:hypothetical protein
MTACRPMSPCCAGSTSAAATRSPWRRCARLCLAWATPRWRPTFRAATWASPARRPTPRGSPRRSSGPSPCTWACGPGSWFSPARSWAQVVANNPFPDEPNPRWVHAIFRNGPLGPDELAAVAAAQQRARDEGSDDEARVVGTTLFLHAPGGLGRSELAGQVVANPTSGSVTPPQRHHAFPFPDAAVTLEAGPMSPLPAARGRAARSGCARTLPRRRYRCTLAPGSCRSRARRPAV